jgi:hypothetical protein
MKKPRFFVAERPLRFGKGLCLVDEYGDIVPGQRSCNINQSFDDVPSVTVTFLMVPSGVPLHDSIDPVMSRINELVAIAKAEIVLNTAAAKQRLELLAA